MIYNIPEKIHPASVELTCSKFRGFLLGQPEPEQLWVVSKQGKGGFLATRTVTSA